MSKELAIIENLELVPFFTKGDSVDEILDRIAKEARAHVPDVSTAKGRNAIKANVTEVTSSKTYLENNGKKLAAEYKSIPKVIDANRKKVKDYLTALQAEVRKPLTDWEEEQARIKAEKLAAEEAEKLAVQVKSDHEIAVLMNDNIDREVAEAKAMAEQERIAREEEMKRQAAETARLEAEQKAANEVGRAKREKQQAIEREAKANQDAIDAQAKAEQAERDRIAEVEASKKREEMARWIEYISEAYVINDRIDAEAKAKLDAETAAENARLAEVKRQQEAVEREAIKQARREADTRHAAAINNAVLGDFIAIGMEKISAKLATKALAASKIRYAGINY